MTSETDTVVSEQPKPARPRRNAARKAAAPAPKKQSEFAGVTATTCCLTCTPERCAISTVAICKHPYKTADSGCGMVTLRNRESVKRIIKRQKIEAT